MKKIIALNILFLMFMAQLAYAHPAANMILNYYKKDKKLVVVIFHNVKDTTKHFIKSVKVFINNKIAVVKTYSKQDSTAAHTATIMLPTAKGGDTLKVVSFCNLSGNKAQIYNINKF